MSQRHPIDHWWVAARGAPPASKADVRAFRVCLRAFDLSQHDPDYDFPRALTLADHRACDDVDRDIELVRELLDFAHEMPPEPSP
jgi:hypothetical protein